MIHFILFFGVAFAEVLSPPDMPQTRDSVPMLQPLMSFDGYQQVLSGSVQCQINPKQAKVVGSLNQGSEIPIRKQNVGGTLNCHRDWICTAGYQTKPPAPNSKAFQFLSECASANGGMGANCETLDPKTSFFWIAQSNTDIDFDKSDFNKLSFSIYLQFLKARGVTGTNNNPYESKMDYWAALDLQSKEIAQILKELSEEKCPKADLGIENEMQRQCEELVKNDYPRTLELKTGCFVPVQAQ